MGRRKYSVKRKYTRNKKGGGKKIAKAKADARKRAKDNRLKVVKTAASFAASAACKLKDTLVEMGKATHKELNRKVPKENIAYQKLRIHIYNLLEKFGSMSKGNLIDLFENDREIIDIFKKSAGHPYLMINEVTIKSTIVKKGNDYFNYVKRYAALDKDIIDVICNKLKIFTNKMSDSDDSWAPMARDDIYIKLLIGSIKQSMIAYYSGNVQVSLDYFELWMESLFA